MSHRLDEIDRQIIYALMDDARNTSAPMIAEDLHVSAGTIRNRIDRLEDEGVIQGYTATVDFEQADGRLTTLFMCTVPAAERERLALAAQSIPGVINVRVLMAGRRDLHVVAVGESTADLREIARSLSELDIQIEDEELVQTEIRCPYTPFGPDARSSEATGVVTLADGTEVIEVVVSENAPIVGTSLETARDEAALGSDVVVTSVERDGTTIRPDGETVLEADDVVTLIPQGTTRDELLAVFSDPESE
ncbi:MAG: winged helix-turn-helix transcriptional regulator [Halovenus sp.]